MSHTSARWQQKYDKLKEENERLWNACMMAHQAILHTDCTDPILLETLAKALVGERAYEWAKAHAKQP